VGPLLLQGNAEQRRATDSRAHDLQELVNVSTFLDVIGQVKMRIVYLGLVWSRGGGLRSQAIRTKQYENNKK
jgi:hypothetical protein